MTVNTSFVIRNADNSFEATAYLSAYESYRKDSDLKQPPNTMLSSDGIYKNRDGFFRPCPLFELNLINQFLSHHNIDLANEYLYDLNHTPRPARPHDKPELLDPVDRHCAEDGCTYRVQFKAINSYFQRLCISKQDVNKRLTRCCVLLLGIHVRVPGAPTLGEGSARGNTHQLHQPRRHMSTRSVSESPGVDFFV